MEVCGGEKGSLGEVGDGGGLMCNVMVECVVWSWGLFGRDCVRECELFKIRVIGVCWVGFWFFGCLLLECVGFWLCNVLGFWM